MTYAIGSNEPIRLFCGVVTLCFAASAVVLSPAGTRTGNRATEFHQLSGGLVICSQASNEWEAQLDLRIEPRVSSSYELMLTADAIVLEQEVQSSHAHPTEP